MSRTTKAIIIVLLTVLTALNAAAVKERERSRGEEITIVHATDPHYLSPKLTDYGDHFMSIVKNADGKVTHLTPYLTEAFVRDMLQLRPDAVII